MIPINTPCPACMGRMSTGIESIPEGERTNLFFWCSHNRVSAAVEVLPGRLVGHWILQPAKTESDARAAVQSAVEDNAFLGGLYRKLAQAQKPPITN